MKTKTKKAPKYFEFLDVSSNIDCLSEDYSVATVKITPELARTLLDKINLLQSLKPSQPELYEMYYWDNSAFYGASKNDLAFKPSLSSSPTECEQLIVRENEIQWTAYVKHSEGVEIRTSAISDVWLKGRASGK